MTAIPFTGQQADIPPPFFPDGAVELKDFRPFEASRAPAIPFATGPTPAGTRVALKIARAISGATELRLLSQQADDGSVRFFIDNVTLAAFKPNLTLMVTGKQKPMSSKQAHAEYARRVAALYPAERLHNGKLVPIHLNLL